MKFFLMLLCIFLIISVTEIRSQESASEDTSSVESLESFGSMFDSMKDSMMPMMDEMMSIMMKSMLGYFAQPETAEQDQE